MGAVEGESPIPVDIEIYRLPRRHGTPCTQSCCVSVLDGARVHKRTSRRHWVCIRPYIHPLKPPESYRSFKNRGLVFTLEELTERLGPLPETMKSSNPETISTMRTRPSLLRRVRSWDDNTSWAEFHGLYRTLVYGLARRSGLPHADAEDVTQDVFKRVAETVHKFESDPNRGTFRGWLMNLTRWRIADKFTAKPRSVRGGARKKDDTAGPRTATIDRIPDASDPDREWDLEWQRHILDAACERMARTASTRHYKIFELHVIKHRSVEQVASELGVTAATIYLVSHRLTKQLKAEVAKLRKQLG